MKMKKTISLILVLMLALSAILTGCSGEKSNPAPAATDTAGNSGSAEKDAKQELIVQTRDDVLTMDPNLSSTIPDWKGTVPVYEGLTRTITKEDGSVDVVPGVAESWDVSEDKMTYTFHLRKDAKWSDGQPVTAKDFEYTWQRIFDPEVATPYAWMVQGVVKNADKIVNKELDKKELGVKAIDDYTFEMKLEKPTPFFLTFAGFPTYAPVRKDLIEKYMENGKSTYGSSVDKIVGNGPFIMTVWEPKGKMVYEPNPNYWNKKEVYLTKLTRQIIIEPNAIAQALIANETDIGGINDVNWNQLVDATGLYDVKPMDDVNLEFLLFNCADPVLKNEKIRLALSLALDREGHAKDIDEGKAVADYSIVPSSTSVGKLNYKEACKGENEVIKALAQKYKAKDLLLEGMKELGLGDDPSKVEVHYMTRGTAEYSKKSAEYLKQNIESVLGIKFTIDMTEWNIMYDNIDAGNYQIAQCGWTADYNDPSNFFDLFHKTNGYYNFKKVKWDGEAADKYAALIDKVNAQSDDAERVATYLEAEKVLLESAPMAPMHTGTLRNVIGKYVKGYYSNPYVYQDYVGVYLQGKSK